MDVLRRRSGRSTVTPGRPGHAGRARWRPAALGFLWGLAVVVAAGCDALGPDNPYGDRAITQPTRVGTGVYTTIAAGSFHSCALDTAGRAWCWGWNDYLQLGQAAVAGRCVEGSACTAAPVPVETTRAFTALAATRTHSCGIDDQGIAWCWGGGYGSGNQGHLGDGVQRLTASPVRVAMDTPFVGIGAGPSFSCGLTVTGSPYCWGDAGHRAVLGVADGVAPLPNPIQGAPPLVGLAVGGDHACGWTAEGAAWCWGENRYGQLGLGEAGEQGGLARSLVAVAANLPFAAQRLVAGSAYSCALDPDGRAWCWGQNHVGQLGTNSTAGHAATIRRVAGDAAYRALSAGEVTACALRSDDRAECWGGNWFGALGTGGATWDGTGAESRVPVPVSGGRAFSRISAGGSHVCAIATDGGAWCWGDNGYGQAGVAR
jgi:alpha-tubulin suppressor-like RCC1 family protein